MIVVQRFLVPALVIRNVFFQNLFLILCVGDLGQTADSNGTFQHYLQSKGQAVLFVGDCSYADKYPFYDNNRWDTWGRFIERSTAYQPWIWTVGNHDIESGPTFVSHALNEYLDKLLLCGPLQSSETYFYA